MEHIEWRSEERFFGGLQQNMMSGDAAVLSCYGFPRLCHGAELLSSVDSLCLSALSCADRWCLSTAFRSRCREQQSSPRQCDPPFDPQMLCVTHAAAAACHRRSDATEGRGKLSARRD